MSRANHSARTLQIFPETASRGVNTTHTMTARLSPATDVLFPLNIDFEIESGPDLDGGASYETPDRSCTVGSIGSAGTTCTVTFLVTQTGTSRIRAWIDHDGSNQTADSETFDGSEGRLASPGEEPAPGADCVVEFDPPAACVGEGTAGSLAEPDGTDVVEVTWAVGVGTDLDCNPETETNPSTGAGSSETYTCTLRDFAGNPVANKRIDAENMSGVNDPDAGGVTGTADYNNVCTTGSNGQCTAVLPPTSGSAAHEGQAGTADFCFWFDDDEAAPTGQNDTTFSPGTDPPPHKDGADCDTEAQADDDHDPTDKVTQTWEHRRPSGLDVQPETATNQIGATHSVTATVYDQFGAKMSGALITVNLEFFSGSPSDTDGNTSETPDRTCNTGGASSCTITYSSSVEGTDLACLWILNVTVAMSGSNSSGVCNGEGLTDASGNDGAPSPVTDAVDVIQKSWSVAPVPACTAPSSSGWLAYGQFSGGVYVAAGDLDGDGCDEIITGAGAGGGPHVRVFRGDGTPVADVFPYSTGFTGGVRVAAGDVDGDGKDELITGTGPGGGPHIRVFDLVGSSLIAKDTGFMAYDPSFTGGVFVAAGDVGGADGNAEIITGPDQGGGPHVKVFTGTGSSLGGGFFAYASTFSGGVRVAATDLDGGKAEIITAPGPGGGPHIRGFKGDGTATSLSFFAYSSSFTGGVFVGAGELAPANGGNEIVTGPDQSGGPHVRIFSNSGTDISGGGFFAYGTSFTGGVRVAVSDVNNNGDGEVVTGPGPGGGPHIRLFE